MKIRLDKHEMNLTKPKKRNMGTTDVTEANLNCRPISCKLLIVYKSEAIVQVTD